VEVRKRLLEIKNLFEEGLIDEDVYKEKEKEIINLI
jgi:hypothetical protein